MIIQSIDLISRVKSAAYEITSFNDYCVKCTYFNYVHCYLNNKCFSENPGFCLQIRSNINECPTTVDTPISIPIKDKNVGENNFAQRTDWVSPDTYVMYIFQNQVTGGLPGRVRLSYKGTNLKFYKAPSLAQTSNTFLSRVGYNDEITINTGTSLYLMAVNTEPVRESFYLEYQFAKYFKSQAVMSITLTIIAAYFLII
eukprot:403336204